MRKILQKKLKERKKLEYARSEFQCKYQITVIEA